MNTDPNMEIPTGKENEYSDRIEGAQPPTKEGSSDSPCSRPCRYRLAAIETYLSIQYREEWETFIRDGSILIAEIMRGEVNPEDECEKFLRDYAPKVLAAHYQENTKDTPQE